MPRLRTLPPLPPTTRLVTKDDAINYLKRLDVNLVSINIIMMDLIMKRRVMYFRLVYFRCWPGSKAPQPNQLYKTTAFHMVGGWIIIISTSFFVFSHSLLCCFCFDLQINLCGSIENRFFKGFTFLSEIYCCDFFSLTLEGKVFLKNLL